MADGPGGLESMVNLPEFYRDKRVLVTGHTGFKGGWLIFWLNKLGARVCGYGLEPSELSLYRCIEGAGLCESQIGDVADFEHLSKVFDDFRPEIVFHLAAQPMSARATARRGRPISPMSWVRSIYWSACGCTAAFVPS